MVRRVAFPLIGLTMASALVQPAHADPIEDFYKIHPVTMVLGYGAGGGFDLYARNVAKYIGKYIPGHPSVIVENMPGAGSLVAANYIYNIASKDGTIIALTRAPVMDPLTGTSSTAFDA